MSTGLTNVREQKQWAPMVRKPSGSISLRVPLQALPSRTSRTVSGMTRVAGAVMSARSATYAKARRPRFPRQGQPISSGHRRRHRALPRHDLAGRDSRGPLMRA